MMPIKDTETTIQKRKIIQQKILCPKIVNLLKIPLRKLPYQNVIIAGKKDTRDLIAPTPEKE
jgi:hypothetical protein